MKLQKNSLVLAALMLLATAGMEAQSLVTLAERPLSEMSSFTTPIPLYKLTGKSFMHYHLSTDQQKKHPVRLPDELSGDLAFFMTFFTGNQNAPIQDYTVTIVKDYQSENPQFYVDKNQNLDFTDDGGSATWGQDQRLNIELSNKANAKVPYLLTIERISFVSDASKAKVSESFSQGPESQGKQICDAQFWMAESRLNIIAGDVVLNEDSFRIGLVDWNIDGSYAQPGIDKLSLGAYGSDILNVLESSDGVQTQSEENLFRVNDNVYQILEINKGGNEIVISKMFDKTAPSKLAVGDKLPDFNLITVKEGEASIYDHLDKKKYTYLKFWASWCKRCMDEIPDLRKLSNDQSKRLKVVGLNCADSEAILKSTVKENKMKWTNGMASLDLLDLLLVDGIPHGILVDSEGKIVDLKISTSDLRLLLNEQSSKQ